MTLSRNPLWAGTSEEPDVFDDPIPPGAVDVVIVGGGYTGLSTALHCTERGLVAHVLEAREIGFGGSGRNVGLVNAAAWLPPQVVRERLGQSHGPRFIDEFSRAPAYVFDLIERHQIRCEATQTGTIHAAHSRAAVAGLKERHAEWARLGEPVDLLDARQMRERVGSDAFFGGLLDHRAGTINPMGYCRGLARAARGAGARLTTGASVTAITRDGALWRVATAKGPVGARHVVLATNAYTDALWPGLSRVFTPIHYFQMSSEPIDAEALGIFPERQGLWDTGTIMRSLRLDRGNRLIIGSMGTILGDVNGGASLRWARAELKRIFPQLGPVRFEEAWHGRIAMTRDHLPKILRLDDGVYTPIGYNGRGITTGTLFGRAMAELIAGADPNGLAVPVTAMQPIFGRKVQAAAYQLAFSANQVWRGFRA